jgi:hypothetical protein
VDTNDARAIEIVEKGIEQGRSHPYVSHRPEGSAKEIGRARDPIKGQVSGAQPEIASKAVREGIEDRLHDPGAVFEAATGSRKQIARVAFLFHPSEELLRNLR